MLGFRVNWEKSNLIPSQKRHYLGFIVDSIQLSLSLPEDKLSKIMTECSHALLAKSLTVRQLACLIGRMSAATQTILPAPLFYRQLQNLKNAAFSTSQSYDSRLTLDQAARSDLQWWLKEAQAWNGKSLQCQPPDLTLESDASLLGWGAHWQSKATGGLWMPEERSFHINVLEMLAGAFAVQTFAKNQRNVHIRLKMDNTSAIAYINHMGGTRSSTLSDKARDLWQWCLQRGITHSTRGASATAAANKGIPFQVIMKTADWSSEMTFRRFYYRPDQEADPSYAQAVLDS